jgi:regulator of extracellular matrix RemA (YlzA/DUF370 family)
VLSLIQIVFGNIAANRMVASWTSRTCLLKKIMERVANIKVINDKSRNGNETEARDFAVLLKEMQVH